MKRGASGLSLVVGIDKPAGMTSHDVVRACRRAFGEGRIGHAGTLDPLATGALLVCIGPASRLASFFSVDDKRYRARIAFGSRTETDDALGALVARSDVPAPFFDTEYARQAVVGLEGKTRQMPPVYSALKVGGKKACDEARAGRLIKLEPREIEVFEARLVRVVTAEELTVAGEDLPGAAASCPVFWDVDLHVSKGTYIRAIARDLGYALDCPAHIAALRRSASGRLRIEDCVTLDALADLREGAALDPIELLGLRFAYAQASVARTLANGGRIAAEDLALFERPRLAIEAALCTCTSGVRESDREPADGELVAIIAENRLAALYAYRAQARSFEARCVFAKGVSRGAA